jgi:ABC-2 type transport system ATP-binding protein
VRRLEIEFAGPPDGAEFRGLDGVLEAETTGNRLRIAFEGSADAIVKAAARQEVTGVHSVEADLEDVFLRYYRNGRA